MDLLGLGPADWQAIELTLKLCLYTTLILLLLATPLAWWLAHGRSRLRGVVQALVALPLVLPPTVLGFYLLVTLGPHGWVGGTLERFGLPHLAFTFEGILLASVIYSMPFAVQPLCEAFSSLGRRPLEVASSLGASGFDRFVSVVLPLSKGGFVIAATLTFAHTLGEFGVILMLGGSIPGETKVLSVLIYDHAEAMNHAAAHRLSLLLLLFAFVTLFLVYGISRRFQVVRP
ncbi:MAG: molybdate ABC transporter permease subunit [Halopseudomonas yangmingensis]|uniref:Molybdenum transport system permease n=1 Tax=Halopseudomonas yangmingensis TaxID=1720063 RepID=A0A1I4TE48_9GAMM|nr:molybdate ABC transporter permease subunit [Halopseudomonas yangmingensis]SFM74945.1 molybdate transport system permease protein [Halopseudomonas yangmingensis]